MEGSSLTLLLLNISARWSPHAKEVLAAVKSSQHPCLRTALTCWSTKASNCLPLMETARRGQNGWTPRAAGRTGEGRHGHRILFPEVTGGIQKAAAIP